MIRKYQVWNSMTYRERSLHLVCDLLQNQATQHGISHVILEAAKNMYKKVSEKKISRGENRQAIIASCVYMACKSNGVPRSVKEVSVMFDVRVPCMTKACKTLAAYVDVDVTCSTPADFVNRFCNKLDMTDEFAKGVKRVLLEKRDRLSEFTPPSAVGGCIMLHAERLHVPLNKKMVADVCQISMVTISKCYKMLVV
jgi:transcription initiation factor TFIIB